MGKFAVLLVDKLKDIGKDLKLDYDMACGDEVKDYDIYLALIDYNNALIKAVEKAADEAK